jgi:hypothetical protein
MKVKFPLKLVYTYTYTYTYTHTYIYIYIYIYIYQSPSFKIGPRDTGDLRRRTEIMPVKDSHTRIKPLPLASGHGGHGRYITVTTERKLVSVGEWQSPHI